MIKLRNSFYVKKIKFPFIENDKLYKEFRATVNKKKRELKRNYYYSVFELNKNNIQATWKIRNGILSPHKKQLKDEIPNVKTPPDGVLLKEDANISNGFCPYF